MTAMLKKAAADTDTDYFASKERQFAQAIVSGDQESAEQVTGELISAQQTLGDLYLKVFSPALVNVGELWCRGDVGVGEEKLATQIVIGQMDRLRACYAVREARSPYRVLVACVEGELHCLGARMIADLCLSRGWKVDFLGPNVPNDALLDLITRRQPQVLALSITMAGGLAKARDLIEMVERLAPSVRIIIGGQAIARDVRSASFGRQCEIGRDAVDGVSTIGKLLRADHPSAVLKEYQMILARRVRDLRTQKGWTQEQLAETTGVTRVCIVAVEGGKQNVSMDILIRISNALGVVPEMLLSVDG